MSPESGEPEFWKAKPAEYIERFKDYERQLAEANARITAMEPFQSGFADPDVTIVELQAELAEAKAARDVAELDLHTLQDAFGSVMQERDAANAALAVAHGSVDEVVAREQAQFDRAEALDAALAEAVKALEHYKDVGFFQQGQLARDTLARIEALTVQPEVAQ